MTFVTPLRGGVGCAQRTRPLVDVDGNDVGVARPAGEGEGDRAGTAAEVEKIPLGGWAGRLAQQQLGAGVEAPVAEHSAIGAQRQRRVDEPDADLALVGAGRLAALRSSDSRAR